MDRKIFVISGLGADHRVFCRINVPGWKLIHVHWVEPLRGETLAQYAVRLKEQITGDNPVILGLSFGGMLAVELDGIIQGARLILVSTATLHSELPFYFRFAGKLGLHHLVPGSFLKRSGRFSRWFFGISSPDDIEIFKSVMKDTDPAFLKWAIAGILSRRDKKRPEHAVVIHGLNDRILPARFITADFYIKGAGHLMVLTHANNVSTCIAGFLAEKDSKP